MDPRVARTQALLREALLSLARERDLDAITVADITERATVNRSTFYQHYADRDMLLADALDSEVVRSAVELDAGLMLSPDDGPPEVLRGYVRHLADNAHLYRQALGEHGSPMAAARLRRRLNAVVVHALEVRGDAPTPTLPVHIVAASITGSLIGVLTAWLEMDPLPPPELAAAWVWAVLVPQPGQADPAERGQ